MSKLLTQLLTSCLFLLFVCLPVFGQTATATLRGTVQDQNAAVIPGVDIVVQNFATSLERHAVTNESGSFTVPLLPPGTYTVTAKRDGFTVVRVTDVVLNVGDQKAIRVELKVGDVNAAIEVRPDETLVNTSPAVATTVDRQFVGNLPLNGRTFQSLILLTPGVVLTTESAQAGAGQFSVNGQRQNANYFTVDGVSANAGVIPTSGGAVASQMQSGTVPGFSALGTTSSLVSIDALEEFKIQTSTYTAELGRQPGGQVQLVTRSGTNQFHGTAFDYVRNEAFDANNWFNNRAGLKRPPLRQNQFGGTFSGPVFLPRFGDGGPRWYNGKDRTFFFFSYEGQRLRLPQAVNTKVPSLRLRQIAAPALQPLLNAFPLPTGPETTRLDGSLSGVAPYVASFSDPKSLDATSVRVDHTFGSKLAVFGRYNEAPSNSLSRFYAQLGGNVFSTSTLTVGATATLGPRLSNEFRFNYSRSKGAFTTSSTDFGGAVPIDVSLLVSGRTDARMQGRLNMFMQDALGVATAEIFLGTPVDSFQRQLNIVDNVSWIKGTHQLRFGVDYRRLAPIFGPSEYTQEARLPIFDTASEARFVNGMLQSLSISRSQGARPVFHNFSAYVQDTWKVSRRLTLDLGLRWEINPAPQDQNGLKPVLVELTSVDDLPTATLASRDTPIYKTIYTAFAPRVGAAYELRQTKGWETVLRGGFGLYYDLGSGQANAGLGRLPFSASSPEVFDVPYPVPPNLAVPPPFPQVTLPITDALVVAFNPDLKLPYTLQWNVSVGQSLGANQAVSFSYVASAARRLLMTQTLNSASSTGARPNPNFVEISFSSNRPTSDYHSLQAQYQRRLSRGLQALVNYTWSHAIDEVSNEVQTDVLDRGNADFDVRHNFSAGFTYEIPKITAGPVLTSLFRDWAVDSTVYFQSGEPLNLTAGISVPEDAGIPSRVPRFEVRPDVVPGQPFWIDDPTVPGGRRINSAAFQEPPRIDPSDPFSPFSRQGTLGRNVVRLPARYQINIALRRQFNLSERLKLQIKAEVFNLLNHPLFGNYARDIRGSTVGVPSAMLNSSLGLGGGSLSSLYQMGGPRSMQFSLRLSF